MQIPHWIAGKPMVPHRARMGEVFNPSTGAVIRHVPMADPVQVDAAVSAAREAFASWASTPVLQRARVMFRFKALLDANIDALARLVSEEHGKVVADARGSVQRGIEVVEFACGMPHVLRGNFSENVGRGIDCYDTRLPIGVCVGITPFNFPAMVPMWMFPVAIACGNTFVLKPSERDPSTSVRIAELMQEAGLPDGVLNIVHGDKEAVDALLVHPDVNAISFVGSTPIAKYIYEVGTAHGKRVQALGGAKNHLVVMPDADIAQAADAIMGAAYGSAGERCMAISVVVAVGTSADPVIDALKTRIAALKIGASDDPQSDMGPLVTRVHCDRVRSYVDLGVEEGARLVVDGRNVSVHGCEQGFFLGPCLFDHVTPNMRVVQEEIFGPVLCVVRVKSLDDAIACVNSHPYGNGTSIFTQSGHAAREYTTRVQVGMHGVNVPIPVPMAFHSFGGVKQSIFGSHGMHGDEGVHFYTQLRTITARWPKTSLGADFHMPIMG